jgi:hypothetical protein
MRLFFRVKTFVSGEIFAIVFSSDAKKLRMVKVYNKQLKKAIRNGKIKNKNLNSRTAG